ncbi:MAG: LamG-like jellyroll fold domain-containing protein, partial [Planctomycetota bacterium]
MFKKSTLLTLASVFVLVLLTGIASADITTDLLGYWKLDDNANDSSGNGYHGEEFGNPSYVPGMIDQAMDFDGPEQSVYIEDFTAVQNQDAVTICMWVKPDRNSGTDQVMWFTDEDGSYGRVRFGINGDEWEFKHGDGGANPNADDGENPIILGEWTHLVGIRQNGVKLELFVNGVSAERIAFGNAGVAEPQASIGAERRSPTSIRTPFDGVIDEVRFYTRALSAADIQELFSFVGDSPTIASNPDPLDEQTDVPRDAILSWKPGGDAEMHDVYLGTNFDDVNTASTTIDPAGVYQGRQNPSRYPDIGTVRLQIGETYYWRIDGVGAAPGNEIYKGNVWQFTVEPHSFAIDGATITARASSNVEGKGPENTVNGSGLDESGLLHGNIGEGAMYQPTWIEYDLGRTYKLHEMWVWNSNESLEAWIGVGFKEVVIEYSVDGSEFKTLGTTHEFAQALGESDYAHNTTVDMEGIAARHIRLTANSNWKNILEQYSLSEVRFFYIPVQARAPKPASGDTEVPLDVTLDWTAGREAAEHNVYLSTSEQAVIDGTAFVEAVTGAEYGPLSLNYGMTYYWRVDEVNNLEDPAEAEGDIWSFTAKEFLVIDDFELYDSNDNQIWWAWKDGLGYVAHGNEPAYPGNGTGSEVGDGSNTDSYTEQSIVNSGAQSMPYWYDNNKQNSANYSEAELTLIYPRDWTEGGVAELSLWFRGNPASVGSFTEAPAGTYTITATGIDIWGVADQFHYAFKTLNGAG